MTRRHLPENEAHLDEPANVSGQAGPDSNGLSDSQGLSQIAEGAEESVQELADAGQDYEAGILKGSEDASDHPEKPVPSHDGQQRPEDGSPDRGPA
jgi:hypothetical protein